MPICNASHRALVQVTVLWRMFPRYCFLSRLPQDSKNVGKDCNKHKCAKDVCVVICSLNTRTHQKTLQRDCRMKCDFPRVTTCKNYIFDLWEGKTAIKLRQHPSVAVSGIWHQNAPAKPLAREQNWKLGERRHYNSWMHCQIVCPPHYKILQDTAMTNEILGSGFRHSSCYPLVLTQGSCKDWTLPLYVATLPLFSALVYASDVTNLQVHQHYGDEAAKAHCVPKFFNWNELTITWSSVARIEKRWQRLISPRKCKASCT